nr:translation initiation factor IF-2 [Pongo abelii]
MTIFELQTKPEDPDPRTIRGPWLPALSEDFSAKAKSISEEGAGKGGKKVNLGPRALRGGGRGRTPDPLFPTPPLQPPPHPVEVRALRGASSGAWEARTLPTPSRDPEKRNVPGGSSPPPRVLRAGETSRTLPGEEAVNSPSVRASPRRASLPRPRRGPPRPPACPGAAAPGVRDTGGESGPLPGELRELAERPQEQRRGKSGLTCHYFLRHLGSTCQRPHKALWTPRVCIESTRGFLAARGAELLADLFVRVDVSVSAPAAALPGSPRAAGVAFRAAQTSSAPAARRGASALGNRPAAVGLRELGGRRVPESTSTEARFKKKMSQMQLFTPCLLCVPRSPPPGG